MRVVVTGLVGQYPFGGVIWDYLQYLLGFRSLGHEVLYLEDSGAWPYDPEAGTITDDCSFALRSLKKIFSDFDLPDAWVYRNGADGKFYGAGESKAREWLRHGDLLVNVSSAGWLRDYDLRVGHRMFIDGDPMFCQIGLLEEIPLGEVVGDGFLGFHQIPPKGTEFLRRSFAVDSQPHGDF